MIQVSRPATTVALLLGARVGPDGPSAALCRRADLAAALWHEGRVGIVLACGGGPVPEALVARGRLVAAGLPEAAVLVEPLSRSTRENLAFALPILDRLGRPPVLIVTDRWHQPRARLIARRLGLRAGSASPDAGPLPARLALREAAAYLADWWRFRP